MTPLPITFFIFILVSAFFGAFVGFAAGLAAYVLGKRSRVLSFLSGGVSGAIAALVAPVAGYVLLEVTMGTLGGYIVDRHPEHYEGSPAYEKPSSSPADQSNELKNGKDRSSTIDKKHPQLTEEDKKAGWEFGVVKWYNETKGYGFISPEKGGKDVFVHASALEASGLSSLEEETQIAFILKQNSDRGSVLRIRTTTSAAESNLTRQERLGEKRSQTGEQSRDSTKARFERIKPHVNLVMLGQTGHGKTILTAAITKYFGEFISVDKIDAAPEEKARGITIATAHVEYETDNRHYGQTESPTHQDLVKNIITGAVQMDGAILVVDAIEGPMRETKAQVKLARQVGVPALVVYLNSVDQIDEEAGLRLVEMEVRELLSFHNFPGDDIPIIKGSALAALESRDEEVGETSVRELMAAVDEYIPTPERPVDQPFLMPIEDVFSISGRGTVVTGRVERGRITEGEEVEIVGLGPTRKTTVTGVEMFRKLLTSAEAGDNIGALLRGIGRDDVERGQVLCQPGSVTPHTKFEAEAYILTKEEGGQRTPFFTNYRPQFYFRTSDVTGTMELPDSVEMVMPGDNVTFTVELIAPIAMEEKLRFAIREGGRTVGAGVVTRIIE